MTAAPSTFIANGEHRFQGLFAQGTYRFTTVPVDVTIGVRGDFWQALNASVFTVNSATNNVVPNTSASSFDPRIGLKFYASDEVTVRAAIYRNFSAPGMNQMYRSFASGTSYTAINPSLQPMTNFGQEVGMDFNWKGFSLSGTYFNNNLDNFIDFVTICNTNAACAAPFISAAGLSPSFTTVNQYNNVGNATFQGFELIGSWQALDQLRLTAGYVNTVAYLTSSSLSDARTDRCSARPGAQLDGHRRRRMAAPPGAGPHRDLAVVPGLLEQHGPYPAERRCHDHRPRRDLFAGEGGGRLRQRAEPYELPVPRHGLLHDVVRGHRRSAPPPSRPWECLSQSSSASGRGSERKDKMRKLLICLAALLAGGTAAAQHQHGKPGTGAPEAFTASPAFGPDGTLWLVRPMVDRIVVTHSRDLGKTFSQPVMVTPEPMNLDWGPDARARIVVDDKGGLVVTFGTFQDKNFNGRAYFARSTDDGASFTKPRPITADTTSQRFEVAGVDPSGRVFAAWLDKRNVASARAAGRAYPGAALAYAWEDGQAAFGDTAVALDNTCECCRIGLAFAGAGRPAVAFRNIFPGSVRDHAVITFQDDNNAGTGCVV